MMNSLKVVLALVLLASIGSAAMADNAGCPKWEAGSRYPWQSNAILRGDRYAWLILDVDRRGNPVRCGVHKDNYPDPESRVWLCKQYYDFWRGPLAAPHEPAIRTLERYSLIPSPKHQEVDWKARPAWFRQHPEERSGCYPEPTRPDRMDL
jgi:hypothetical protein